MVENCFTILYWFLPYNNVNNHICMRSLLSLPPLSPSHLFRLSHQSARLGFLCL